MPVRVASWPSRLCLMLLRHVLRLRELVRLLSRQRGVRRGVATRLRLGFAGLSVARLSEWRLAGGILRRYVCRTDAETTSRSRLRSPGIRLILLRLLAIRSIIVLIRVTLLIGSVVRSIIVRGRGHSTKA